MRRSLPYYCWDFVARPSFTLYSHALAGCAHLVVVAACSADLRMPAGAPVPESTDVIDAWPAACWVPCLKVSAVSFWETQEKRYTALWRHVIRRHTTSFAAGHALPLVPRAALLRCCTALDIWWHSTYSLLNCIALLFFVFIFNFKQIYKTLMLVTNLGSYRLA